MFEFESKCAVCKSTYIERDTRRTPLCFRCSGLRGKINHTYQTKNLSRGLTESEIQRLLAIKTTRFGGKDGFWSPNK